MQEIKVGVLLPRSSLYPMMGSDVFTAVKAGLKHLGHEKVTFCTENIGFGGDEDEVYAKMEKILLQDDPDLIIAFLDHYAAAKIEHLAEGHNKLLLVLDTGGQIPDNWQVSPLRFTISLQAALGSRLTARLAAANGDRKNIFATSFYEGGYLNCYSCLSGLAKAGGEVYHHDMVPFRLENYTADNLKLAIDAISPDAVLAQFSAEAAGVFLDAYAVAGLNTRIYASPFMLEEEWLSKTPFRVEGITGCVPWSRQINSRENQIFLEVIESLTGKKANVFHLLGWEAALFCRSVAGKKKAGDTTRQIAAGMHETELASPRGTLKASPDNSFFFAPMYIAELVRDEDSGNCKINLLETAGLSDADKTEFITDIPEGPVSKWTNTYLCI